MARRSLPAHCRERGLRRIDELAKIGRATNSHAMTMNLSIRDDESSLQHSLKPDPRFWVRVVKPIGETLVISDALLGGQSPEGMGKALTEVLVNHANDTINAIPVSDIAPYLRTGLTYKRRVAGCLKFTGDRTSRGQRAKKRFRVVPARGPSARRRSRRYRRKSPAGRPSRA